MTENLNIHNENKEKLQDKGIINQGNIENLSINDKPDFFEPDLKQYQPPDFINPSKDILDNFVKIIRDENILVLGSGNHIDKTGFARHLAWYFNQSNTNKYQVLEWYRSSEPQSIDVKLQKEEESTIFLLTEVLPQNVGYNLSPIQQAARSHQHYVIITTDAPSSSWNFSNEKPSFWQDISSSQKIYDEDNLVRALFQKLKERNNDEDGESLPPLFKELFQKSADDNFIGELTLRKVAVKLETPNNIALFLGLLEKEIEKGDGELQEEKVRQLIEQLKREEEALNQWYYHFLDRREQLLALGLNFFDGLLDDQFFAALEKIVNNVWQKRDPSLQALDYCDLDNLGNFFNLTPVGEKEKLRVESRFPQQRRMLFKVAWKSHRRQILAVLDTIAELIQGSVNNRVVNQELYATPKRCRELRKVLSETLSDIGWISSFSVQDTLLRLAADKNRDVQEVAASTMARWRNPNYQCEEKLFEVLDEWQGELVKIQIQRLLDEIINAVKDGAKKPSYNSDDYVWVTIALTVGYAALYDSPNQLHSKLYDLVEKLSKNNSNEVQEAFREKTLPKVVYLHLEQEKIKKLLYQLTKNHNLIDAVSSSLAEAYRNYPDSLLELLQSWKTDADHFNNKLEPEHNENLLATVALTYGKIQYDEGQEKFIASNAFEELKKILERDRRFFLRRCILISMGILLLRNFNTIKAPILEITTKLTLNERKELVNILKEIYLYQRQELQGGNDFIKFKNRSYPVWQPVNIRPLTEVEELMLSWVKDESNPIAQEIATQTLVRFASELDVQEENLISEQTDRLVEKKPMEQATVGQIISERQKYGPYLDSLIPWLVTRNQENYRIPIHNLLPEAWKNHKSDREAMDFVLSNWRNNQKDQKLNQFSLLLDRGIYWVKNLWKIALLGGGILTWVGIAAVNSVKEVGDPARPERYVAPPVDRKQEPAAISNGITVLAGGNIIDIDSPNFDKGKLTVQFTANGTPEDRLGIRDLGANAGEIGVNGKNVTYGRSVIGRVEEVGNGTQPLVIALNANATRQATQALLRNIAYKNVSDSPSVGSRTVKFWLDDGDGHTSKKIERTINVVANNQTPTITVPEAQTVKENSDLAIAGIKVSDDNQQITVTLEVSNGTIAVKNNVAGGLNAENVRQNAAKKVTLAGPVAQINTTLSDPSAIIYRGNVNFSGNDALKITVNDAGQSVGQDGKGLLWPPSAPKARGASSTISISVIPTNVPFIITAFNSLTADEDSELTINGISIEEPTGQAPLNAIITFETSKGIIKVKSNVPGGVVASQAIGGNGTKKVTLDGSIAQINATLADASAITYRGDSNFSGKDSLNITVDNGIKTNTKKIPIAVKSINDPPQITVAEALAVGSFSITKPEAVNLIKSWLIDKKKSYSRPYNMEAIYKYTTGSYSERVQGTVGWLRRNNAEYEYQQPQVEASGQFFARGNQVIIDARVNENATLYVNGGIDWSSSGPSTGLYRFSLQVDRGIWKIADSQEIGR